MKLEEAKSIISDLIDEPIVSFQIQRRIFENETGKELFNETVRQTVTSDRHGVYLWVNSTTSEIVYIGMAGKIKADGTLSNHSIKNRLVAPRTRDKITGKYIQTNDYVNRVMTTSNIDTLEFYIMFARRGEPPAYIEALLLYSYYKKHSRLPKFNNAW